MHIPYGVTLPDNPRWGWEPPQPPVSINGLHADLVDAIEEALTEVPIEQQTVYIAGLLDDDDKWRVDILSEPPTGRRYGGWLPCLVDFDQYHGTVKEVRRSIAEALADDLMDQVEPDWKMIQKFGPEWDAEPLDWH